MKRSVLLLLAASVAFGHAPLARAQPTDPGVCPSGAQVAAKYCKFFVRYDTATDDAIDARIGDSLGVTSAAETRSIALVIAVDNYPNLPEAERSLSAAAVDRERLQKFLMEEQKFDEVIVLANGDATAEAIDYFLLRYLPNRGAEFNHKARLMIAYSGHGRPDTLPGAHDAAFVLAQADDMETSSNIYLMSNLANRISALSNIYFHILTLVNACFGGNTFNFASGGNPNDVAEPGSYVITAGSSKQTVVALLPERGSVFFDLLVSGLEDGVVDRDYNAIVLADEAGETTKLSLTRTGAIFSYLDGSLLAINKANKNKPGFEKLSSVWFGPAYANGPAMGGFFFLTEAPKTNASPVLAYTRPPHQVALSESFGYLLAPVSGPFKSTDKTVPSKALAPPSGNIQVPVGPVSSIPNRPDIKIFKPPRIYPVRGLDISWREGRIDWKRLDRTKLDFIYTRALGWPGKDRSFDEHWAKISEAGIDRGAYIVFNYCKSAQEQFAELAKILPMSADALPTAIDVEDVQALPAKAQRECADKVGLARAREQILELAELIQKQYIKVPIIYGNRSALAKLADRRFERYSLWLANFAKNGTQGQALKLPGSNPWTLWQYSGTLNVAGIGDNLTGSVFFGTRDQYAKFKQGLANVALAAVTKAS